MRRFAACIIFTVALSACVSTPFKGVPAAALNDDQLITELSSVYQQLGMSTGSLSQLRMMMPAPDIRLTANSFTNVYLNTQVFGDTAYTTGTATTTTTYSAYDANDINRSMNQIAQNIQLARINALSGRRFQLESEARRRVEARRQQEMALASALQNFFAEHPSLRTETDLLQTILPWEQQASYRDTLGRLGFEAETVLAHRSDGGRSGRWYGTLQVRLDDPQQHKPPALLPVRGDLSEGESDMSLDLIVRPNTGGKVSVRGTFSSTGAFSGHLVMTGPSQTQPGSEVTLLSVDLTGSMSSREGRMVFDKALTFNAHEPVSGVLTLLR